MSDTRATALTPSHLLQHWQAHRRLTRKVIEAFPADVLYTHSVGGMRPFGELANEIVGMAVPTLEGLVTGDWGRYAPARATTQAEVLALWDAATPRIDELFVQVPDALWPEVRTAFGAFTMPVIDLVLYVIDNEIHHRGQGTVYLRSLGIAPPQFFDRG
ncbi:MAG: DinB family protein [Gemmatimonadaceae bacterium]|jgi:uncharacterized damage-inducible protein DinB|nr:DinB family protein [Gemmatimonadaceae bacterium]